LRALYGEQASLELVGTDNGTTAKLRVPFRELTHEADLASR
jgi:hypothetical protein